MVRGGDASPSPWTVVITVSATGVDKPIPIPFDATPTRSHDSVHTLTPSLKALRQPFRMPQLVFPEDGCHMLRHQGKTKRAGRDPVLFARKTDAIL